MGNSKYQIIYTDLDGTLLDDRERHYQCYLKILKSYGGTPLPIEEYWDMKRKGVKRNILLEKSNFEGGYEDYMREWMESIESDKFIKYEVPKEGALDILKYIKNNCNLLCLVTMRQSMKQLISQLESLKLKQYFDRIYKGDPFMEKKKDIVRINDAVNSLVIGDTETDEDLADNIGATFIAVSDGLRETSFFRNPIAIINNITDLKGIL